MNNYNHSFARLYDILTSNIDYKSGSDFISGFFKTNGIEQGTILDLACGTCSVSYYLAKMGYSIVGVDYSEDMLQIASNKLSELGCDFSLIKSNMLDLELTEQVDGCICTLDSLNHLNSIAEVEKAMKIVHSSLKNNGLFIFDMNSVFKHREVLGDNTFVFDDDDYFLAWDNELCDNNKVRILLDFFTFNGESYDRYSEEFYEVAYEQKDVVSLLEKVGFTDIEVYGDFDRSQPNPETERIYYICKKG